MCRDPNLSVEERTALWQFLSLDSNRDGVLSKKELRPLKRDMRQVAGLKLCGKRLNKHCDANTDNKVSQAEWRACLDMQSKFSCMRSE
jgi:hypothetical protein